MATTKLSDIYVPEPFDRQVVQETKKKSALWQSNIVVQNGDLNDKAQGAGKIFDMPKLNDISDSEANVSSDNPGSTSTPEKVTGLTDQAIKHFRNQSWSQADLTSALTDPKDPLGQLASYVGNYWQRQYQSYLINGLKGVMADNVSNNSGDMVLDVSSDVTGEPTSSELVSFDNIADSQITMGDALEDITAIACHSAVYNQMRKNGNITYIRPQNADMSIPMFGEGDGAIQVIVDDGLPTNSGTNRITYTSILFGRGAVGYGEGNPATPSEVDRKPAQGDGEGVETLYSRRHFILHPMGVKFTNSSVAGKSPTNSELAKAANWTRVYDRKQVPIAFLKTNG